MGKAGARTREPEASSGRPPVRHQSPSKDALANLQRLAGNSAVAGLVGRASVQRVPAGGAHAGAAGPAAVPTRGPMSRADFESVMRQFGVTVRTGMLDDQVADLNLLSGTGPQLGDRLRQAVAASTLTWAQWDPGDSSEVYTGIAHGFVRMAFAFGGIPGVTNLVFYNTEYVETTTPTGLRPFTGEGAHYSAGTLVVYASSTRTPKRLPAGRDQPAGPSPRAAPDVVESMARYTIHELGHGVVEAALTPAAGSPAPDPQMLANYGTAVGWRGGQLFDIQNPADTTPIDERNWNTRPWGEQPISGYMTTALSEDFPEAMMAYVTAPAMLRARSRHRYDFIHAHRAALASRMRPARIPRLVTPWELPSGAGDYPAPDPSQTYA